MAEKSEQAATPSVSEVRRGPRTTEFWLSLVALIVGVVAGLDLGGWIGALVAAVSAGFVAFGYTQARARTKGKAQIAGTIADAVARLVPSAQPRPAVLGVPPELLRSMPMTPGASPPGLSPSEPTTAAPARGPAPAPTRGT